MTGSTPDDVLLELRALHARVDADAARLEQRHSARLVCARGCSGCCLDDLTVFDVEAERIRLEYAEVLAQLPHPAGACAFLDDEGACRVYGARPYVCRTQGLPLLHFHENAAEDIVEERSICELNAEGGPLDQIDMDDCWLIGPIELELQKLQESATGDQRRTALRNMFEQENPGHPSTETSQ